MQRQSAYHPGEPLGDSSLLPWADSTDVHERVRGLDSLFHPGSCDASGLGGISLT